MLDQHAVRFVLPFRLIRTFHLSRNAIRATNSAIYDDFGTFDIFWKPVEEYNPD